MSKEKVNFSKAKTAIKKNKFIFPIEFYYNKTIPIIIFVGVVVFLLIFVPALFTSFIPLYGIWVFFLFFALLLVILYQMKEVFKSIINKKPNIIIEKDGIWLLCDGEYATASFDEIDGIELKRRTGRHTTFFLSMTFVDNGDGNQCVNYSMDYGMMYVNGQSINAYQAFDLIWQVFWNYHEETDYPLRLRKKEEWEW